MTTKVSPNRVRKLVEKIKVAFPNYIGEIEYRASKDGWIVGFIIRLKEYLDSRGIVVNILEDGSQVWSTGTTQGYKGSYNVASSLEGFTKYADEKGWRDDE